jgi:hypothetical protein
MSEATPIEDRTFDGATVLQHAVAAEAALRAINHLARGPIPAPVAYDLLGELKILAQRLPQALTQLADGLDASLHTFDVYDAPGRAPRYSVIEASTHLTDAARHAEKLADLLEAAQTAIRDQGHRPTDEKA